MEIVLPGSACRARLRLHDHDGRDQVASMARAGWRAFEAPLPQVLHGCACRLPGLVIDVGANTGFYALLAAVSGSGRKVVAFEADPAIVGLLRENVAANGLAGRVRVVPMAVSDQAGHAMLYRPTQEHGLVETSASLEAGFKPEHGETLAVPAVTLDGYFDALTRRFRRISLIKIDVEGHEAAVLRGATRLVERWRPVLFVEVLARADTAFLTSWIAARGYRAVPLQPDRLDAAEDVRFVETAWNQAFVPREGLNAFLAYASG